MKLDHQKPVYALLNIMTAVSFVVLLFFLGLWNVFHYSKEEISEMENRVLVKMPSFSFSSLRDGSFSRAMEDALKDRFFLRTPMIRFSKRVEAFRGIGERLILRDSANQEAINSSFVKTDIGWVMIFYCSPESEYRYAQTIATFAENRPDLSVINFLIPSKVLFLSDRGATYTSDQRASIRSIEETLSASKNVHSMSPLDEFAAENPAKLYFQTDYHWNGFGSALAYRFLCNRLGFDECADLYRTEQYSGFVGNLLGQTGDPDLQFQPDTVDLNIPLTEHTSQMFYFDEEGRERSGDLNEFSVSPVFSGYKASYAMNLGGDYPRVELKQKNPQGRGRALVLKDSFGNALVPLLINIYDEVHVIDPRHYCKHLGSYIEEHGIDTVYVINIVDVVYNDLYIENLNTTMNGSESP